MLELVAASGEASQLAYEHLVGSSKANVASEVGVAHNVERESSSKL